ncbi:MAG: dicarboxylate/amino acid:cation symporter [Actinomycetaceae bacterium]|nr:dicarboxylate/amino acid:cation symporter [Actinomycetaceae bacterium]
METKEKSPVQKLVGNLLFWVIIAIVLGIILGQFVATGFVVPFVTFNVVFGKFLNFAVPLIILGLIAPAIADIGKGAGKWLLTTIVIAYGSTLFAGFGTYFIAKGIYPFLLANESLTTVKEPGGAAAPLFSPDSLAFEPLFGVLVALVLAFVMGLGMVANDTAALKNVFMDFRKVIMWLIRVLIVPCLPIYIFGTFLDLTKSGEIASVISAMLKVIVFSIVLTLILLMIQYVLAGAIAGMNPLKAFGNMLRAYFTALGTSSSAATIPVTYSCMLKNKVSEEIAGFVAPLCATIHLAGSTTKIVAFSLAIITIQGGISAFGPYALFICLLGIIMIAAPGVPGGAIAAAQAVLVGVLAFDPNQYGLMVALYIAIDSVGTATNVTGDGAIALVINKLSKGSLGTESGDVSGLDANVDAVVAQTLDNKAGPTAQY